VGNGNQYRFDGDCGPHYYFLGFWTAYLMSSQTSYYGSKEWANQTLRNVISDLKEGATSCDHWLWRQRLSLALIYKKELLEEGFPWQAARIDNWIHRLQPLQIRDSERAQR